MMPSPYPKDAKLRQRRNKAVTRRSLGPRPRPGAAPGLPKLAHVRWHPRTRAWWKAIWASPMAQEFLGPDQYELVRLAELVDAAHWLSGVENIGKRLEVEREIRLSIQRFGFTPIDRRRLEWGFEEEPDEDEQEARPRRQRSEEPEDDPRRLWAVS